MICSIIVYFANNENVTKYIDPIISIVSCMTLLVLSYPYSKYKKTRQLGNCHAKHEFDVRIQNSCLYVIAFAAFKA